MELNTPPPGASRAVDILPAVLRPGTPGMKRRPAAHPAGHPGDALGAMLQGSTRWDSVATPVTWTVTAASWLLTALDVLAVFLAKSFRGGSDLFSRILTWDHHPGAVIGVAVIAALAMGATAVMTGGLRKANLVWLRVWIAAAVASAVAIAAMVVAAVIGLVLLVLGIILGVIIIAMIGVGLAGALGG